jgi:MFS family permease
MGLAGRVEGGGWRPGTLLELCNIKVSNPGTDWKSTLSNKHSKPSRYVRLKACLNMAEARPFDMVQQNTNSKHQSPYLSTMASLESGSVSYSRNTRQKLSDIFTIFASGAALISDGYQNNLMTMTNVVLRKEFPKQYTTYYSTAVSNALLVGEIIGQVIVGLTCDYLGRKFAIIVTTLMIVIGGILATAASGTSIQGMFWMLIVARGIVGFGTGGEYPASSTSASEAANQRNLEQRGPLFILVTNLPLSIGGPLAVSIFLIILSAAGQNHLGIVWRVCMGIGSLLPLSVFYFRMKMLNSTLYRHGAIKKRVPYTLVLRYYWRRLLGTCGAWFLYDFITFPNGVFSATILSGVVKKGPNNVRSTAEWQLLLGAIALPGVVVGAYLRNRLGRKNTMMLGFSGYLVFGLIIGCAYEKIIRILPLFVIFYGLMQSLGNMGPGDMLGLLSSESYATAVRGTCYGISAALGKTGAALGTNDTYARQGYLTTIAGTTDEDAVRSLEELVSGLSSGVTVDHMCLFKSSVFRREKRSYLALPE